MTKSNLGRKGFILQITVHNKGTSWQEPGCQKQTLWRSAVPWLILHGFLICPRATCPGMAPPIMIWALPQQLLIKTIAHRFATGQSYEGIFSTKMPSFPHMSRFLSSWWKLTRTCPHLFIYITFLFLQRRKKMNLHCFKFPSLFWLVTVASYESNLGKKKLETWMAVTTSEPSPFPSSQLAALDARADSPWEQREGSGQWRCEQKPPGHTQGLQSHGMSWKLCMVTVQWCVLRHAPAGIHELLWETQGPENLWVALPVHCLPPPPSDGLAINPHGWQRSYDLQARSCHTIFDYCVLQTHSELIQKLKA